MNRGRLNSDGLHLELVSFRGVGKIERWLVVVISWRGGVVTLVSIVSDA
ncbi:MAG: hypothetical protein ACI8TQ_001690 [Planctomycetota bacterium]|jgi:hypothetical protein